MTTLMGVNLGYLGLDRELLVFPHGDFILNSQRKQGPKTWCDSPVLSYIIDHPDGRILWDTGLSDHLSEEWLPEWQWLVDVSEIPQDVYLEQRLKGLGLGPEDFRYVMLGHLHTDHAGGLRLFEHASAEIICHEDEYEHVKGVTAAENFFVPEDWRFLLSDPPTLVSGDQEIMRDVWTISLPGHTPGTMGLRVKLPHTGWVILACDAVLTHESYGPPPVGSVLNADIAAWSASVEKLRKIATESEAWVFPGHDEMGVHQHADGSSEFRKIEFTPGYTYE